MEESDCDWRENVGVAQSFTGYLAVPHLGLVPPKMPFGIQADIRQADIRQGPTNITAKFTRKDLGLVPKVGRDDRW